MKKWIFESLEITNIIKEKSLNKNESTKMNLQKWIYKNDYSNWGVKLLGK